MKKIVVSEDRDTHIFLFLFRWKLATTAALARRFFPSKSGKWAYNRLTLLKGAGYIRIRTDSRGLNPVWVLTEKGYLAVKDLVPEPKEDGFKTESAQHDLICMAVHLGEWIGSEPEAVELVTEQELRRTPPEFLPAWASRIRHRPDGYWKIQKANRDVIVALEVELSRKMGGRYQTLGYTYGRETKVDHVLWVVPGRPAADRIRKHIAKAQNERTDVHLFTYLSDFRTEGWLAPVFKDSNRIGTLREFLTPEVKGLARACYGPGPGPSPALALLDTRMKTFAEHRLSSDSATLPKTVTV